MKQQPRCVGAWGSRLRFAYKLTRQHKVKWRLILLSGVIILFNEQVDWRRAKTLRKRGNDKPEAYLATDLFDRHLCWQSFDWLSVIAFSIVINDHWRCLNRFPLKPRGARIVKISRHKGLTKKVARQTFHRQFSIRKSMRKSFFQSLIVLNC